jgi:two-component system, LytTR family, sensor histidine kinase AgrC
LKTANPAVNALLQAKLLFCEKRSISLEFYITSRLDNLNVPSWEFCRVLGNLIDNSIYALGGKVEDRIIELYIYEDLKNYGFKIKNNGPEIPEKTINKIFEPGFTTKGELGQGMGLAISKEILEAYGGNIKVTSNDKETIFEGWVSK